MSTIKNDNKSESRELLPAIPPKDIQIDQKSTLQHLPIGIPRTSPRIWKSDFFSILICLTCSALAMLTVFHSLTATWLGQVNQLIALGVLLQLMALCTQKQLQLFLMVAECLWDKSSLQNFESIFKADFTASRTPLLLRVAILLYLALPVGLGVVYKNFTGGLTTASILMDDGMYGWTGAPGTKALGSIGIGLFYNATSTWWHNPAPSGVFGFNLHVESRDRSALLDGPIEDHVINLQRMLSPGEYLVLNTTVNATVCDMVIDLADPGRPADFKKWFKRPLNYAMNFTKAATNTTGAMTDYANDYFADEQHDKSIILTTSSGAGSQTFAIIIPPNQYGWVWNTSFVITSRWNASSGSFGANAQAFHLYRQKYKASWMITPTTISLNWAEAIEGTNYPAAGPAPTIEDNFFVMQDMFVRTFMDYDWKWLGDFGTSTQPLPQQRFITSDTTIVAGMVWARLNSAAGLTNPWANETELAAVGERLYRNMGTYEKRVPTLKRSTLLASVLAANPILLFLVFLVRIVWMHNTPISKDFGFAALLAGIDKNSLAVAQGSAYSGKLDRDVRISFSVINDDDFGIAENRSNSEKVRTGYIRMEPETLWTYHSFGKRRNDRVVHNTIYS